MQRPNISATQLDMYCRCPEAYRRRYIEGEILPPGVALLRGKSIHAAAERNFTQKIKSGEDMPAQDIEGLAVETFERAAGDAVAWTVEESSRGIRNVIDETKDQVAHMAKVHAKFQAPDYQPVAVEHGFTIPLPGARDLIGFIDLIDNKDRVVDIKTAQRSKPQSEADASVQLSIYAAAFALEHDGKQPELRLDVIVNGKRETKRQVLETKRDDRDIDALAARIDAVTAAIDAGAFPPAVPGAWNCAAKWCGYFRTCRFVNANRGQSNEE